MIGAVDTLLRFSSGRRLPLQLQSEEAECALACLSMVATWHGYDTDLITLRRRFPTSKFGATARDLIGIAGQMGFGARAVRCELEDLPKLRAPCVLHWNFNHFVVLKRASKGRIWIHDPATGSRVCSLAEASRSFTGVAIELAPAQSFERKKERTPLRIAQLWRSTPQLRTALIQGILLSLFLELFVLLSPFLMQLVIDQVILKSDRNLLVGLVAAFALLQLFAAAARALRALVFQFFASVLSFDIESRLFHHLIRLPLEYFQKRSLGDVFQRFHSLEPIKQILMSGALTAVIDGTLAILTCVLMFIYSVKLGAIVVSVFLVYCVLRFAFVPTGIRYTADQNVAEAREHGRFLEVMRAMQTIKIASGESNREAAWQNSFADKFNAGIRNGNLNIGFQLANSVLTGLSDIGIIYLAALAAMEGSMTIGVITAFLAYKAQFMTRMVTLVDQVIQFKMLDVPLARVADIALADREPGLDEPATADAPLTGAIELKNVVFSYGPSGRKVLDGVDLRIEAGEFLAITGASGEGKTTLLKLLLGLYSPTAGEIEVDGKLIERIGPNALRRNVGVVMQEEQLLAGTLAENIALFDDQMDFERVRKCASDALIADEIESLPMRYETLVGDMGSGLSTGQRQRLLIARALYRQPRILVLDEGTANIDPARESQLVHMLRTLPMTRVVVAHSPTMAHAAGRVLELRNGRLFEVPLHHAPSRVSGAGSTADSHAP